VIDLYYWPTPNGHKITLFLEESGLPYRIVPVDISKGEQFKAEFLAFSPNNRMPAIIDRAPADEGEAVGVFESGAILVYLAEKAVSFCRRIYEGERRQWSGYFGKWEASAPWRAKIITLIIMHRSRFPMRSNVM
jgi:GST-like protein